jgi:predicted RNase H-like HicB family nuclease
MPARTYTAISEREGDLYVALCPELDVASQGPSVEEATANLKEAVELFLEFADPREIAEREHGAIFWASRRLTDRPSPARWQSRRSL